MNINPKNNYWLKKINQFDFFSKVDILLANSAVAIITIGVLIVLGNHLFSIFQPFRGPSKFLFWLFLFISLFSTRISIWLLVFSLPLMPNFHTQLELIIQPSVKYFFAFPGVDAITGLIIGSQLKYWVSGRNLISKYSLPPWYFGLLLIILIFSTILAVSRNLHQSASVFLISDLIKNIIDFKLINNRSDYLPIADLMVFIIGLSLVLILIQLFQNIKSPIDTVFRPLTISILVSASWGVFQGFTSFGLKEDNNILIRSYFFGYGATGFQPDIHSYAGIMCVGAVGLLGYIELVKSKSWRYIIYLTVMLSWVAMLMSKSRATLILATVMAIIVFFVFYNKRYRFVVTLIFFSIVIGILLILKADVFLINMYHLSQDDRESFVHIINHLSSWRYDLHKSALYMWGQLPLMGVGLGNFYRVSSIYEFSHSTLMPRLGGENAHNYFLQLLTEIGAIGFVVFLLILILPYFKSNKSQNIYSIYIGIFSLFLGNLYSHLFIIRENLYLLMVFIALLYSNNKLSIQNVSFRVLPILKVPLFLTGGIIVFFISTEIINSYNRPPFNYGRECYRSSVYSKTKLLIGGHVVNQIASGRYLMDLPKEARGVSIVINNMKGLEYLPVQLDIFDKQKNYINTKFTQTKENDYFVLANVIPENTFLGEDGGVAVLTLTQCLRDEDYDTVITIRDPKININDLRIINKVQN